MLAAAVLAPAPVAVLPFVVVAATGCMVAAWWPLPASLAAVRASRRRDALDTSALVALRRDLERLPETQHPLGL